MARQVAAAFTLERVQANLIPLGLAGTVIASDVISLVNSGTIRLTRRLYRFEAFESSLPPS